MSHYETQCKDIENIIAHKILGDNFGNVFSFC